MAISFNRLFFDPNNVQLIREHGVKFATDTRIIWNIDRLPLSIRQHFEVAFEDHRIGERHSYRAKILGRKVITNPGPAALISHDYSYYEAWVNFIQHHDQIALSKSRFSFADPAGCKLSLLYASIGSDFYLGGIPSELLESAELFVDGLQAYYCHDSRDLIMLAKKISVPESIDHRHIVHYYRNNEEYDLLSPAAFLTAPAEEGDGVVPERVASFIKGNQAQPWAHY